ncbi:ribonuclease E G, chloroplastic isoform X2 [Olea europaea subsp. europaea]|uniref:Ribonuclease E G, chloroplastic isoform X2 n=1 Tax=Olea europaea subsp. europaea TaxID=158383 RepID=A0A8S0PF10_OLEEU|nr:ribonuclease E G, chloroplastic isoform X2 [Olea europaea subsp. europaea]
MTKEPSHYREFSDINLPQSWPIGYVTNYLQEIAPDLCDRVELYSKRTPLFNEYGLEEEINSILSKRAYCRMVGGLTFDGLSTFGVHCFESMATLGAEVLNGKTGVGLWTAEPTGVGTWGRTEQVSMAVACMG